MMIVFVRSFISLDFAALKVAHMVSVFISAKFHSANSNRKCCTFGILSVIVCL